MRYLVRFPSLDLLETSAYMTTDDDICKIVKNMLIAVYMGCSDQRMVHHAANHIGLYVAFPFRKIEWTREEVETPSVSGASEVVKGDVASPGIFR